ncbi:MAG: hypothetical protein QM764_05720 [Chitinophagaceae bacterium]
MFNYKKVIRLFSWELPVAIIFLLLSCNNPEKSTSSLFTKRKNYNPHFFTPSLDGRLKEWGPLLSFQSAAKLIYAIANDDSALFIAIKSVDRRQQLAIIQNGLEIFIDPGGKKSKSTTIRFPLGGITAPLVASGGPDSVKSSELSLLLLTGMQTMELTGFKEGLNDVQPIHSDTPVKAVVNYDVAGDLFYELAIPLPGKTCRL